MLWAGVLLVTEAQVSGPVEVVIRAARPEELPAVLSLLGQAHLPAEGVAEAFGRFVVADAGGRIVGVAGLEVHEQAGLLRSVAVDREWRGRGLGGALTEEILRLAASEGVADVYLLTDTASDFFPRHGFRRTTRGEAAASVRSSVEFTTLCPESSTVMVRSTR